METPEDRFDEYHEAEEELAQGAGTRVQGPTEGELASSAEFLEV